MVDCTLRRMRLMGFRSISFQDVDFDNPTFIVGRNGAGKSNFTATSIYARGEATTERPGPAAGWWRQALSGSSSFPFGHADVPDRAGGSAGDAGSGRWYRVAVGRQERKGADTQQVIASVVRTARQRDIDLPAEIATMLRAPVPSIPDAFGLPPPPA